MPYHIDDITIAFQDENQHAKNLEIVPWKPRAASFTLRKCNYTLYKQEVKLLSHMVGKGILKPDPRKVKQYLINQNFGNSENKIIFST